MIDFTSERVLTLEEAVALPMLRKRGGEVPKTPSTIFRWIRKGLRGIRLESALRGGIRVTSEEALARFFERVTTARDGQEPVSPPRTPTQRHRASAKAAEACERAGF